MGQKPVTLDPTATAGAGLGQRAALTCVIASAALLSSSYTMTKVALRDVPPLTVGLIRFTLAALLLGAWVHLIRRYPVPAAVDLRRLALGGVLGITLYFSIENIGVQLATASDAALLVAAYPAITAFLELVVYRQRTRPQGLAGIALAIIGVYFVVGYAPAAGTNRFVGDILLVVSGVVWALYNFATRSVSNRYPTPVVLYYQAAAGAVGFVPLALVERSQWHAPGHPEATIATLAGLTLLCSIAGLGLYAKSLQRLRPSTAVNLLNLVPVFGLIIAVSTLGESVTSLQLLGGAIVLVGVTITTRYETSVRSASR